VREPWAFLGRGDKDLEIVAHALEGVGS